MPRKKNRSRDWVFGSPTKRLLLEAILRDAPVRWTKTSLARRAGAHPKGGLDEHLLALVQLGLLTRAEHDYELAASNPLTEPLRLLLAALEDVNDEELARPPS